jgi:hypothetical protein
MKRSIALQVILDTKEIIEMAEPADPYLALIGITARHLCEYAVMTWGSFDSPYAYHLYDGGPLKLLLVNAEHDFLNNGMFMRLSRERQGHIRLLMTGILTHLYYLVDSVITKLNLSEYQTSTFFTEHWVGKCLVLEVNT